jgi:6,7-dimethyl-8-ribityllumazine synthase
VKERTGALDGTGRRFAIVVSRFNEVVTEELVAGALEALTTHGVSPDDIEVVRVPGAFELPGACARVLSKGGVDGVVALGCVIRGETPHFEFVAGETTRGLGDLARSSAVPVSFGVLTTDTLEQALRRAGSGAGNKGWEAALTALEVANLYRTLR